MIVIITLLYIFLPALALHLCRRYEFLNRVGSVVLAYAIGLLLGFAGLSNDGIFIEMMGVTQAEVYNLQEILMYV